MDTVIPLGLVLNELLTNALKYAFPNNEKGNISVSLKEDKNVLLLKVADDGVDCPPLRMIQVLLAIGLFILLPKN